MLRGVLRCRKKEKRLELTSGKRLDSSRKVSLRTLDQLGNVPGYCKEFLWTAVGSSGERKRNGVDFGAIEYSEPPRKKGSIKVRNNKHVSSCKGCFL